MHFQQYYQNELALLRELGKEFSNAFPKLAPFLSQVDQDPDVERLLEGFSFVTAGIHRKLDDELPELTRTLFELLWPDVLRLQPSCTIIEYRPVMHALTSRRVVPRGIEVDSKPVSGTRCRFRTCNEVEVYPVEIGEITCEQVNKGTEIGIRLDVTTGNIIDHLENRPLKLYVDGDRYSSANLMLYLLKYLAQVSISVSGDQENNLVYIDRNEIRLADVTGGGSLLVEDICAFPGHRILQDYFIMPEKYHFIEIHGMDRLSVLSSARSYTLRFQFDRRLPKEIRISRNSFRLYCVPAVNLFSISADPLRMDNTKVFYRIRPAVENVAHYQIYSVLNMVGYEYGGRQRHEFEPFLKATGDCQITAEHRNRFQLYSQPAVVGDGLDTFVGFSGPVCRSNEVVSISLDLICTNGNLPQQLQCEDICHATGNTPEFVKAVNVLAPTTALLPLPGSSGLWSLIASLGANYTANLNTENLKVLLTACNRLANYNRQSAREHELRMSALKDIKYEFRNWLIRGVPVNTDSITIQMDGSKYGSEGELYLFMSMLNLYFHHTRSINSVREFIAEDIVNGEIYTWPIQSSHLPTC